MPDNNGILSDLEFENQINDLGDNQLELIKFVARQQYSSSKVLIVHDKRLSKLEARDRKTFGISGGIGGIIGAAIASAVDYLIMRR